MKASMSRRSFIAKSASFLGAGMVVPPGGVIQGSRTGALCRVKKEIYVPSPAPRVSTTVSMNYIGRKLRREEVRSLIRSSDWHDSVRCRRSEDNGRSWSDWSLLYAQAPTQGDFTQSGGGSQRGTGPYDPVSGNLIKPVFQRIVKGDPRAAMKLLWSGKRLFCDHGFYQLSDDDGVSWGRPQMLRYEEGPDFDPENWGDKKFFRSNEMYIGQAAALTNGTVIISATVPVEYRDKEDEKYPSVFPNDYRQGCVAGAICFVGRWNADRGDYEWETSNPVLLPRRISSRGLVELNIDELTDGSLLLVMRGSNARRDPLACPGRKWFSLSRDGGLTWSEVQDIRYDTGETLYSPASISRTIRSSKTGRLYWIGNIPDIPPEGNSPRYPLQIVEIDEEEPSFKKKTVTTIDDRDPSRDSEHLQLSNFSLLENRETKELEVYLTRLGENGGGADIWTADTYKYTLVLR